ncbi:NifB/NifX family molybdenum-iron cluster-binding protein [Candidatus Woesearchaeota archaeon]|nr:NifB/NifX family molybdenum-iron cluster-binding protein [Candidatus Woesearchaeota archaeon]
MKIVIPTEGKDGESDLVSEHFGRCRTYTFLNDEGEVMEVIDNTSEHMGGTGLPPELMKLHGADILLCQGLGPRALSLCNEFGIEVYVGRANTVKDIFDKWKNKQIKKATNNDVCKEHSH